MIWDFEDQKFFEEKIFGDKALSFLYESSLGKKINIPVVQQLFSMAYGTFQDTPVSKKNIPQFIKEYGIKTGEFEDREYKSFNDYFSRRFRFGARNFEEDSNALPAFCEGRYLAYEKFPEDELVKVKGQKVSLFELLRSEVLAERYREGPMFIARLAPDDYHRFHFPDDGRVLESCRIQGRLHSVGLISQKYVDDIYLHNERVVNHLETKNFGRVLFIEIGAFCVGKIVQTYEGDDFRRGEEKGYFKFGGSTVIFLGEKGSFIPDPSILEKSSEGIETYVKLGTKIATKERRRKS
jgi:phosphatidylserine decarboxylase